MKGIEFRTREGLLVPHCPDCWNQVEPGSVITDPATYDHVCDGVRDITVLRMELDEYEDSQFNKMHPEDYLATKGLTVISYEWDQADYCVYIAIKGRTVPELPPFFKVSNHRPADNALR